MFQRTVARLAAAGVTAVTFALAASPASATYSAVYAFGDSLTDNGNLFAATTAAFGPSNALPQAYSPVTGGYLNGRFSNGKASVEYMATRLGLPLVDLAFGGATTDVGPVYNTAGGPFGTGLKAQLQIFDAKTGGAADPNGLYFIWAGSNDLRQAFEDAAGAATPADAQTILTTAATSVIVNLRSAITHLWNEGARHFFIPTEPDFGLTPEGKSNQAFLSGFTTQFDAQLAGSLASVANPTSLINLLLGADIDIFDTLAIQRAVYANPGAYGIGDVDNPCFTGYVGIPGAVCAAGLDTTNMFWDKVHPTAATNTVLGFAMAAQVPEPSALLLVALAGMALVGTTRRRAGAR